MYHSLHSFVLGECLGESWESTQNMPILGIPRGEDPLSLFIYLFIHLRQKKKKKEEKKKEIHQKNKVTRDVKTR